MLVAGKCGYRRGGGAHLDLEKHRRQPSSPRGLFLGYVEGVKVDKGTMRMAMERNEQLMLSSVRGRVSRGYWRGCLFRIGHQVKGPQTSDPKDIEDSRYHASGYCDVLLTPMD